jgi:LuxR family maltose regulon positive regulatory protein
LTQGNLFAAEQWAETVDFSSAKALEEKQAMAYQAFVHLLLAQERFKEVQVLLADLEKFVKSRGYYGFLIKTHVLQALTRYASKNEPKALGTLKKALKYAAPEGYVRSFLDEGPELRDLLVKVRATAPEFVDRLLEAYGHPQAQPQPLLDPLSPRELEVLRLVAAGLSNREVADHLFIASSTVRKHLENIYSKLQVHRRTKAVARAQDLGLL